MMWGTRSVGNHGKTLLVTHTKAAECIQPTERNPRVAVLHSEGALHDESVLRAILIHLIEMWVLHARCTLEQSQSVSPCIDTAVVRCSLLPLDQCSLHIGGRAFVHGSVYVVSLHETGPQSAGISLNLSTSQHCYRQSVSRGRSVLVANK
jgi:hypothetical protein